MIKSGELEILVDTIIRSFKFHYNNTVFPVLNKLLSDLETKSDLFKELWDP